MAKKQQKTNALAIASFVISLFSPIMTFIIAPIALILGIVALKQIKKTKEEGRGLAIAGVIISGAFLALFAVVILFGIILFIASLAAY